MTEIEKAYEILTNARVWAEENFPKASGYKHAAFANTVQEIVTHISGGFGGPSIREHVATNMFYKQELINYEEAIRLVGTTD